MSFSTLFLYITMSSTSTFFFISEFLYTKSTNSHFRHPRSQSTTNFSEHPRVLLPINGQIIWQSCKKQSENVLFSNDHDDLRCFTVVFWQYVLTLFPQNIYAQIQNVQLKYRYVLISIDNIVTIFLVPKPYLWAMSKSKKKLSMTS